jgi:hypothetical protein
MSKTQLEQQRLFELEFTEEQIPSEHIIERRNKTFTGLIPITVCSYNKTDVDRAKPVDLYTCKRIKAFRSQFGNKNYIILSKKYGLMFSDQEYDQYEDKEQLLDIDLLYLLKKQNELYPSLELAYYDPRPLTLEKFYHMLKRAGFIILQFKTLKNYEKVKEAHISNEY